MAMIITRQQAMDHLRIDDATAEADDLDLKILAASDIVLDYLEMEESDFVIESSDSDSDETEYDYPSSVQAAALLLVGDMYRFRDSSSPAYSEALLPSPVRAILYPIKTWGLESD